MKRVLLPIGLIIGALALMVALFSARTPPEQKKQESKDLLVEVLPVVSLVDNLKVLSQGTVEPKIKSALVSEVTGRIVWVADAFVKGGLFKQGEVLVKVDDADYKTALKSAQATLARAKATLEEEKARAKVAKQEWDDFMQGDAPDLYIRKPQLAREVANVQAAQADVERAQRELARTEVKANFNGLVKDKMADLGQFVSRGTTLASVYGTDVAEVRLPVSDLDVSFLSFDSAYELNIQKPKVLLSTRFGTEQKSWSGTIVRSEGVVDESNRLVYLVAEINDPYGIETQHSVIEFGRFVQAEIIGKQVEDFVVIPRDLIYQENHALIASQGKLDIRDIVVEKLDKRFAYVSSGLQEGELLISTNIKNPLQGAAIKVLAEVVGTEANTGVSQ